MHPDDTLRKLALPLALVAAFLASSASTRTAAGTSQPMLDAATAKNWHAAYDAAAPLLQMGN